MAIDLLAGDSCNDQGAEGKKASGSATNGSISMRAKAAAYVRYLMSRLL
jgi:hypothetical protein